MTEIWSPQNYPRIADTPDAVIKLNILRFSWWYGCVISPEKNLDNYVARASSTGHCACHNERHSCPCPQAAGELEKHGYCSCRLFIGLDQLKHILERVQKKVRAKPNFRPDK